MQSLTPQLTKELAEHVRNRPVSKAPPFRIDNYRQLVEHVARLAYVNRNQLLFFRGQNKDYQNKAGASTLYPAIYRGDQVPQAEFEVRFRQLEAASKTLTQLFHDRQMQGHRDVARKRYIQWSILQHYVVVPTPLLDVTHSLRAACSFAQLSSTDPICYVYILGLPYTTNRISIHSEEDVVNTVGEAISALARDKTLPQDVATALNDLRRVRNMAAHTPGKVDNREINRAMRRLRELLSRIPADRI